MEAFTSQTRIPVWVGHGRRSPVIALLPPESEHKHVSGGHVVLRHVSGHVHHSLSKSEAKSAATEETHVLGHNDNGEVVAAALLIPTASPDLSKSAACCLVDATLTIPKSSVVDKTAPTVAGAWKLSRGTLTVPAMTSPPSSEHEIHITTEVVAIIDNAGVPIAAAIPLHAIDGKAIDSWSFTRGHYSVAV
ncbi:hypothetical protein [Nocardia sp. NPDC051570]|uniref:hypothetical protein n=1 Tax=Nocardia sp. NPDC051570 TaxID=3364324 RepID=UPI0037B21CBF